MNDDIRELWRDCIPDRVGERPSMSCRGEVEKIWEEVKTSRRVRSDGAQLRRMKISALSRGSEPVRDRLRGFVPSQPSVHRLVPMFGLVAVAWRAEMVRKIVLVVAKKESRPGQVHRRQGC